MVIQGTAVLVLCVGFVFKALKVVAYFNKYVSFGSKFESEGSLDQ